MKTFGMMAAVAILAIGLAMPAAAVDADKFTGSAPVLVKERVQNQSANRQSRQGSQQARQNRQSNDPEIQAWQEEIKKLRQEVKQLAQKYRNAAEGEREAIKAEIRTKLERIFDLQSQIMQKRIDKLAERLEQLRAKKTERDSNRSTLIDQRLERMCRTGNRNNNRNNND